MTCTKCTNSFKRFSRCPGYNALGMKKQNKLLAKFITPIIERFLIASYGVYVSEKEKPDRSVLDYDRFALAVKCRLETAGEK